MSSARSATALAAALFAAALLVAGACSSSPTRTQAGGPPPTSTAAGAVTPPTTATTATAAAAAPTTVTTAPAPTTTEALVPQQSPDVAARSLFNAWSKGDRVAALHVATRAAVAALFSRPVASYSDRGCQDPISDRALCAFGVGDGLAQVGTVSLAGGWVVETVTLE